MITSSPPTLDEPPAHAHSLRADAILARYLDAQSGSPSFRNRAGAARHFLHWVRLRHVPLSRVDAEVVQRFTRHRCQCASFSPRAHQQSGYITNVRRFVAFLEDQGDGVNQAAVFSSLATSMPSRNVTPLTTFGN
jgi:hypothetical protein